MHDDADCLCQQRRPSPEPSFLDIGNRYVLAGAQYDPQVLAGLSQAQIASQLRTPSSPVAQAIDGSAKAIIAAIEHILHHQATS